MTRLGKFYATKEAAELEEFYRVFYELQFVPVFVQFEPQYDAFVYVGTSPKFDDVPEGAVAAPYEVTYNQIGRRVLVSVNRLD